MTGVTRRAVLCHQLRHLHFEVPSTRVPRASTLFSFTLSYLVGDGGDGVGGVRGTVGSLSASGCSSTTACPDRVDPDSVTAPLRCPRATSDGPRTMVTGDTPDPVTETTPDVSVRARSLPEIVKTPSAPDITEFRVSVRTGPVRPTSPDPGCFRALVLCREPVSRAAEPGTATQWRVPEERTGGPLPAKGVRFWIDREGRRGAQESQPRFPSVKAAVVTRLLASRTSLSGLVGGAARCLSPIARHGLHFTAFRPLLLRYPRPSPRRGPENRAHQP
jgi:hypothetical protein